MKYQDLFVPASYACSGCNAHGVKLWRQYNTMVSNLELKCAICLAPGLLVDEDGIVNKPAGEYSPTCTDQVGGLVPAVPTEECDTYWGYGAVPVLGRTWWRCLPTYPGKMVQLFMPDPLALAEEQTYIAQRAAHEAQAQVDRAQWRSETVFVVFADSYAQHSLWSWWSTASDWRTSPAALLWEQLNPGVCALVGTVGLPKDDRQVWVSVFWVRLEGRIVAFVDATSSVVDWSLVEAWVGREFPGIETCNANNFHQCAHAVQGVR